MGDVRNHKGQFARLKCVNGHDRCYEGPVEDCPYCERVTKGDETYRLNADEHDSLKRALRDSVTIRKRLQP